MIINSVKPLVYYFKAKNFTICDPVFNIHTKLTVYLVLICSILISGHSFTGKPIDCIVDYKDHKATADMLCWINGTFTTHVVESINGERTLNVRYQKYYQWIITILLIKAALFSVPQRLWKAWENGRIQQLCGGLNAVVLNPDCPDYQKGKARIVSYLRMENSRIHGSYVCRYVVCEVMNFMNVVLNMYILNALFHNFWSRYWPAISSIFKSDGMSFSALASEIFPIWAKCYYTTFGPSGSPQIFDALCFAFIYIWYVVLLFVSGCNLILRSVILLSSWLRAKMIQSFTKWTEPMSKQELKKILPNGNIGDWFILFLLGKNLNRFAFREILDELANGKEPLNNDI